MQLGKKVDENTKIHLLTFDSNAGIYTGPMTNLQQIKIDWECIEYPEHGFEEKELTLKDIADQVLAKCPRSGVITVIVDSAMHGEIYRYGNHGAFWEYYGKLLGYA